MIAIQRQKKIKSFAEYIADLFSSGYKTDLSLIATNEEISYYFDNYENAFDGMLLYDNHDFHIHINIDRGNHEESKRGRFTFAHELGHYFIDEHRLGLKYGELSPHPSLHNLNQKEVIELEADYFASCLLMPENKFQEYGSRLKTFSLDTITHLSNSFQTSILATVLRFTEIGTHEIMAVFSQDNIAKWFAKSEDFPQWPFRFKVGGKLPPTTVASEFYTIPDRKLTDIENLDADDWFYPFSKDSRADRVMHEQCYYSESYNYVISLIWFD